MSWEKKRKYLDIRPYFRLMRLDNLTGTFLLLYPCLWSLTLATDKWPHIPTFLMFIAGAFVMRSAGCVINDIADRKFDAKVRRTKNRPLARGDLKLHDAFLLLFLLLLIGWVILINLKDKTTILGYMIMVLVFIYPLMKRFTHWPQLFLALTINWGAIMGWAELKNEVSLEAILLYVACIFWTLGYDTVYAHQDKNDDIMLGLKSTAIKFGTNTKRYLYFFYSMTVALLWIIGVMTGAGVLYHLFLMVGAVQLFWQVNTLDIHSISSCRQRFHANKYFGLTIFLGTVAGKFIF